MKLSFKILLFSLICLFPAFSLKAKVVEGDSRGMYYYLFVPSQYDRAKSYPLIVALHWSSGRGTDMLERWEKAAENKGYFVACPNSRNPQVWNLGKEDKDVLRMVDEIKSVYSIDPKRIFVTGFSAGATYAYYFGLVYPDTFAASAPIAGSLRFVIEAEKINVKNVERKIPFFIMHGDNDNIVNFEESQFARDYLEQSGFPVKLRKLGGEQHNFPADLSWVIINWFDKNPGQ